MSGAIPLLQVYDILALTGTTSVSGLRFKLILFFICVCIYSFLFCIRAEAQLGYSVVNATFFMCLLTIRKKNNLQGC